MSLHRSGPWRWRAAGRLAARLPSVRGSDRLVGMVRGRSTLIGGIRGNLTNGVVFDFAHAQDPAVSALVHLQFVPPALAAVLESCLLPGDCFYDVGANIGLYSLWAARLVGPSGEVHAFEPVSETVVLLERFLRHNAVENVTVFAGAVGAATGDALIETTERDSAHGRVVSERSPSAERVPMISLDRYVEQRRAPDLIKIDVEGHELEVLQGGGCLLNKRPMIVLEAIPSHLERSGATFADIKILLSSRGYELFDLSSRGLRPSNVRSPTTNVLALCSEVSRHRAAARTMAFTRFPRNQTV